MTTGVFPFEDLRATAGGTGGAGVFEPPSPARSYAQEVRADGPAAYWQMGSAGTDQPEDAGGTALVLTGATPQVAGATTELGSAVSFDGIDDYGRVSSLDLSGLTQITTECWLKVDGYDNHDHLALEHGEANYSKAWVWNPDSSGGAWSAFTEEFSSGDFYEEAMPRPSAGWHHIVVTFDRAAAGLDVIRMYVDGLEQSTTPLVTHSQSGTWQNYPLMVMCRSQPGDGAKSLNLAGDMQHLAIYPTVLSYARIAAHYAARAQAAGPEPEPAPLVLAPFTVQLVDQAGDVVSGEIELRRRDADPAVVYADELGSAEVTLPAATGADGAFLGWVEPGEYEWRATHGGETLEWNPVNVNAAVRAPDPYAVTPAYSATRELNPETATTVQTARALGTLIDDLIATGVLIPTPSPEEPAVGALPNEILADSPYAYYRMANATTDSSGNGRTLDFHTPAHPTSVPGIVPSEVSDGAQHFASGFVGLSRAEPTWAPAAMSFEVWANLDLVYTAGLLSKGGHKLFVRNTGALTAQFVLSGGVWWLDSPPGVIVAGTLYHLVGMYDGSAIRLYIDGQLVDSVVANLALGAETGRLRVADDDGENFPAGVLDEAAFYDHALSPERVAAHYHAGIGA